MSQDITAVQNETHAEHHEELSFLYKYILPVDHKIIGLQYIFTGMIMAIIGGYFAYAFRMQLAFPGEIVPLYGLVGPGEYNMLVTNHGTIMIFWVAMPVLIAGFGNFIIPLMIGCDDMVFPRLNRLSYQIFFVSAVVLILSFFVKGGGFGGAWTAYPPLSSVAEYSLTDWGSSLWLLAVALEFVSFLLGVFIIGAFYNLSAELKHFYYDLKNNLSNENKYLAAVTENGLWLRDQNDKNINFINAVKLKGNYLENVSITVFTNEFNLVKNIESKNVEITDSLWIMESATIYENNFPKKQVNNLEFQTSFDKNKLYSLFSNLYSVSIWNLFDFIKDPNLISFSSKQIFFHLNKLYSYPFYVTLMVIVSSVVMLNLNRNRNRVFFITIGVLLSVSIYFLRYMFDTLGETKDLTPFMSIWLPILFITIITCFGLVRINEK